MRVSRARRWIVLVCGLALVLAAVATASWLAVRAYAPLLARERVEVMLSDALGRPVRVERVVLQPWLGRIAVLGVATLDDAAGSDEARLRLERAELRLSLSSLWRRELVLSRIVLQGLDLHLGAAGAADGTQPRLIPEVVTLGPLTVRIRTVQVAGARVVHRDAATRQRLAIEGLDAALRPGNGGMGVTARAAALELHRGELRETVHGLDAEGFVRPDRLTIRRLALAWQGREVRLRGEISHPFASDPQVRLTVIGEVDLGAVTRRAAPAWTVAGVARTEAEVSGSLGTLRATVGMRVRELTADALTARQVVLRATWGDGRLDMSELTAQALGGAIKGSARLTPARLEDTRVTWMARDLSIAEIEALAGTALGFHGRLDTEGELEGDPRRLEAARGRLSLAATQLELPRQLARMGRGTAQAEGRFTGGTIDLASARGHWPGLRIELAGRASLEGPLGLRVQAEAELGPLARAWEREAIDGRAALTAEATGRWVEPRVEGRLRAPALQIADTPLDQVDVLFRLVGRTLHLDSAGVTIGQSRVSASGRSTWAGAEPITQDLDPWAFRFDLSLRAPAARVEDLERWVPEGWRATGGFAVTGRIAGTPATWRGSGHIESARLVGPYRVALEQVAASFTATQDRIDVTQLGGRLHGIPVVAQGWWAWDGSGQASADLGPTALARLPGVPSALALSGTARATLRGSSREGAISVSGRIQAQAVSMAGVSLGRGAVALSLRDRDLDIDAAFPERQLSVTSAGRLEEGSVLSSHVRAVDLPLERLLRPLWPQAPREVAGRVSLTVSLSTPLKLPGAAAGDVLHSVLDDRAAGTARIVAESVSLAGLAVGGGTVALSLRGRDLEGQLAFPARRLTASASGRLERAGAIGARIHVGELALGPLIRHAGSDSPVEIDGMLSGDARVTIPLGEPRAIHGSARLEPVTLEVAGEAWKAQGPVLLRRAQGRLHLDRLELEGPAGTLSASGWADDRGEIEGRASGRFPLAILPTLRPEIREAGGHVEITARMSGTTAVPVLVGDGAVRAGRLALRGYPTVIRDVQGRFSLSPYALRLAELRGSVAGGSVRATGDVALEGRAVGPYRVLVVARNVATEPVEGLETAWDADLEVVGRGWKGQVRGEARLLRGRYSRDLALLPLLLSRPAAAEAVDAGRNIGLRVLLRFQDNLVVRTNLARFRADGTVTLQGSVAAPVLFGNLEAREGFVVFRRHRFTLQSAAARFADPRRIDPILSISATARIREYDVTMNLQGRADELRMQLSSTPPLPQEDLLALVTFGVTRAELGESAGAIFAGEAARLLAEEVLGLEGGTVAFDVFEVETSGPESGRVKVGKRLNERTLLLYSGGYTEAARQTLRVEYQLLGPLLLAGEQDFRGGYGADVVLRLRFR
jgi:autotransporter translocation and assembly factor TamB